MEIANFYWTVVAALVVAAWAIISFIRDRNALALERSSRLIEYLLELDKIIIEHPDIQKYLASTASKKADYFYDPKVLEDDIFFKSKAYVYRNLNIFDEILSSENHSASYLSFLINQPAILELSDWESYIKQKLKHPLYRSILQKEDIFGDSLRKFWNSNKDFIELEEASPFMW